MLVRYAIHYSKVKNWAIQEFSWVIRLIWALSNSVLVLSETVLVLVIERNGRRDESRTEDQTGANCFELTRIAMNSENITELESEELYHPITITITSTAFG
jgi:hypothetical protein